MNSEGRDRGFTLIEMLITLVLVALLTATALPAYDSQVRRAFRTEARTALAQVAFRLERQATATGSYPSGELPEALAGVPSGRYRIVRVRPTDELDAATHFTLRAVPQGGQARDPCGSFTLNNAGERGLADNQASVADCWNR